MSGCRHEGCWYHLWADEAWDPRERRFRRVRTPVYGDPAMTCALAVASCGPLDLRTIAAIMGLSHERVRQIEAAALRRLRRRHPALREVLDALLEAESSHEDAWDLMEPPDLPEPRPMPTGKARPHPRAIPEATILAIVEARRSGQTYSEIARRYHVSVSAVGRAVQRGILDRARCTGPGAASPGRCSGPHPAASQPSPSLAGEGALPQRGDHQ